MHSLPLFHRLAGQPVIVVGEGEAAEAKSRLLERAGARIVGIDDPAARLRVLRIRFRRLLPLWFPWLLLMSMLMLRLLILRFPPLIPRFPFPVRHLRRTPTPLMPRPRRPNHLDFVATIACVT